ncbi:MAG: hypothetical protein PHY12_05730 [Eubacteriales bacterium]|nr:hypothetical protein [Eubacteriales bacterium]
MNTSQKCNCCVHEMVCKEKEMYESAVRKIYFAALDYMNIAEYSIKCKHFMPLPSSVIRGAFAPLEKENDGSKA